MSQIVFAARNRADKGSAAARRIRRSGRIPGVMYGRSGHSLVIDLDAKEFTTGIQRISASTIVKVDVEGTAYDAFVKDTQWNILDKSVLHVDFYEVEQDQILRAKVPIHIQGSPVGIREGGILELPVHEIEVECLPRNLPELIRVDVSNLNVNQSIDIRDLGLAEGVKVLSGSDQVVALVKFAKAEAAAAETVAETAGVAAPAAETAAGSTPAKSAPAKS